MRFRKAFATNNHSPIRDEDPAFGRFYTPKQLADIWLLHESTIRRIFLDEPGVLKHPSSSARSRTRGYVTLRIPESVVRRVYERRSR
jgi:hypothetical protein